jgi:acyl-coenzyme A synthetase/AMP-(fatty) acid ligase
VDEYGPTEATVTVTRFVLDQHYERSPIGKPVSNMFVYILDEGNNPLPVGVPGELCVSGPGVSRGYHNRPELTSKVFSPDPFRKGQTMYRSGDLARWLPDGNVDFLGRLDFQLKIRGYRIELGEIEQAMVQLGEIKESAVLVKQDGDDQNWLCGYFVADSKIDSSKVKSLLARSLPDYMIPQTLVKMESMPLNTSGKIDRHALPEPEQQTRTGEVGEPL